MKMFGTAYIYDQDVITCIQTIPKKQDQIINQSRHMVYYRELSMEQEENKHKTSSTDKVKDGRETNTTINQIFVLYNFDVP